MKKLHWTQRPENKMKVKRMAQKGAAQRVKNLKKKTQKNTRKYVSKSTIKHIENAQETQITFAFGYIQAWITEHSRRTRIPQRVLAQRLAGFLSQQDLW